MEFLVDPIERAPIYHGEALRTLSWAASRDEADSSCSRIGVDSLSGGDSGPVEQIMDRDHTCENRGDNEELGVLGTGSQERAAVQLATIECQECSEGAVSMQTTAKVDPQAPGWTKRIRIGKQPPDRAPCPERVGALEKTIRGYAEKLGDHVVEPSLGLTFNSLGDEKLTSFMEHL